MPNVNILEVLDLAKVYPGGVVALKGVSFKVSRGEIFGILGVNGAGKSTTLNILIGLLTPTSGHVKIFDRDFSQNESAIKQRMNIATAYADLPGNLTIYQNLKVYAMMYGQKDMDSKIDSLLTELDIAPLRNQKFVDLSAGQKTRANLCKSLINDPEILLLDEPTASLDPAVGLKVRRLLMGLQKKHKLTIILTSHNMPEVEMLCNRVALIDQGKIYKIDTPRNLQKFMKVENMEQVFLKLAQGEEE